MKKQYDGHEGPVWAVTVDWTRAADWTLRQVLSAILDDASSEDRLCSAQSAVGVFTTCKRSEWALRRTQLAEISRNNATALETIDTAMFVMCLDNTSPSSVEALAANALHGSYVVLKTF